MEAFEFAVSDLFDGSKAMLGEVTCQEMTNIDIGVAAEMNPKGHLNDLLGR
jgi:hypothetical protein